VILHYSCSGYDCISRTENLFGTQFGELKNVYKITQETHTSA